MSVDLTVVYDTRVYSGVSPYALAQVNSKQYNIWGAGPGGPAMALITHLFDGTTSYSTDTVDNPTAYTLLTPTDGNGNALSASNSAYTGDNTPSGVIYTWNVKDPVTPANPPVFSVAVKIQQVGDLLTFTVTTTGLSATYSLAYNSVQFGNLVFQNGYVLPPTSPTFPAGLGYPFVAAIFGFNSDVIYADLSNNTSGSAGGDFAIITNERNQTPRRVELESQSNDAVHVSYLLLTESDASNFNNSNTSAPQYSNTVASLGSETYSVTLAFGPGGTSAQSVAAAHVKTWQTQNPPMQIWPDRRPIVACYPSQWGSPICSHYALLYRRNLDGSSSWTFPNGYAVPSPSASNIGNQATNFGIFRTALLSYFDDVISFAHLVNAQGIMIWDIETDDPQAALNSSVFNPFTGTNDTATATSLYVVNDFTPRSFFIGDPTVATVLTPALGWVSPSSNGLTLLQEVSNKILKASLRLGFTTRDEVFTPGVNPGYHDTHVAPTPPSYNSRYTGGALTQFCQHMVDKLTFLRGLGASMTYIDSNEVKADKYDPSWQEQLGHAFPEFLLIPEHSNSASYRFSMPYTQTNLGVPGTSAFIRAVYPTSGQVIYLYDTPTVSANTAAITNGVKHGDIQMVQGPINSTTNYPAVVNIQNTAIPKNLNLRAAAGRSSVLGNLNVRTPQ